MKQNLADVDTMMFFDEVVEAHENMLLSKMADAVAECRTADKMAAVLSEDGEVGLLAGRERDGRSGRQSGAPAGGCAGTGLRLCDSASLPRSGGIGSLCGAAAHDGRPDAGRMV